MRFRRAAAVAVGLTTLGSTTPASAEAASAQQDSVERSVIRKINALRARQGVRRLRTSRSLARAADAHSGTIAATGNFSHGAMSTRVRRFLPARTVGETLAYVPAGQSNSAAVVVGLWMRSPMHRATLLSGRFARVGVGRRWGTIAGRRSVIFTVDLASAR